MILLDEKAQLDDPEAINRLNLNKPIPPFLSPSLSRFFPFFPFFFFFFVQSKLIA